MRVRGIKITLLGQNQFGTCFYAYKRKSKLTFSMTENAKSLKYCPNTLRFNDFEAKLKFAEFRGQKSTWLPSYIVVQTFQIFLHQVSFLRRVPDLRRLLGAIFARVSLFESYSSFQSRKHSSRCVFRCASAKRIKKPQYRIAKHCVCEFRNQTDVTECNRMYPNVTEQRKQTHGNQRTGCRQNVL